LTVEPPFRAAHAGLKPGATLLDVELFLGNSSAALVNEIIRKWRGKPAATPHRNGLSTACKKRRKTPLFSHKRQETPIQIGLIKPLVEFRFGEDTQDGFLAFGVFW
jgi:hypothetical protein